MSFLIQTNVLNAFKVRIRCQECPFKKDITFDVSQPLPEISEGAAHTMQTGHKVNEHTLASSTLIYESREILEPDQPAIEVAAPLIALTDRSN